MSDNKGNGLLLATISTYFEHHKWLGHTDDEPEPARLEIVFSSIYGERWVTRAYSSAPEALTAKMRE